MEHRFERWGAIQRSVSFGSFRRMISLPSIVNPERARTKFNRGILEVILPKRYAKRRIHIE